MSVSILSMEKRTNTMAKRSRLTARFLTPSHAHIVPSVELARKTGKFALFKVNGQDFVRKSLLVANNKPLSVGKPADNVRVRFIAQNIHKL